MKNLLIVLHDVSTQALPLACIAGLTGDNDHLDAAGVRIGNDAAWRGGGRPDIH